MGGGEQETTGLYLARSVNFEKSLMEVEWNIVANPAAPNIFVASGQGAILDLINGQLFTPSGSGSMVLGAGLTTISIATTSNTVPFVGHCSVYQRL